MGGASHKAWMLGVLAAPGAAGKHKAKKITQIVDAADPHRPIRCVHTPAPRTFCCGTCGSSVIDCTACWALVCTGCDSPSDMLCKKTETRLPH
eukprot:6200749-Pleurochrysis_carterae.AAC.1